MFSVYHIAIQQPKSRATLSKAMHLVIFTFKRNNKKVNEKSKLIIQYKLNLLIFDIWINMIVIFYSKLYVILFS